MRLRELPADKHDTIRHVEYLDPRPCPNDRWFPGRILTAVKQKQNPEWDIRDVRVVELEVDRRPAREHFEVAMPAGTAIVDFDQPGHFFRTRRAEKVHVDDLPRIYEMTAKAATMPRMDTAIVPARSHRWIWWAGGIGLVVLGAATWRIVTLRRRQAG